MAYSLDRFLPEDQALKQGRDNPLAQKGVAAANTRTAAPAAAQQGGVQAPAGPAANPADSGGKFVNFSRIINANRGAATNTANTIAAPIVAKGTQVQSSVDGAVKQYTAGNDATVKATQEGLQAGETSRAGYGPARESTDPFVYNAATGQWEQAPALYDRGGKAGTPMGDVGTVTSDLRGAAEYGTWQKQAADASKRANALGTTAGQQSLLQEEYGKTNPAYGAGNSRFDAALMGAVGGSRFDELGKKFGDLAGYLDAGNASVGKSASSANDAIARATGQFIETEAETKKWNEASNAGHDAMIHDLQAEAASLEAQFKEQYAKAGKTNTPEGRKARARIQAIIDRITQMNGPSKATTGWRTKEEEDAARIQAEGGGF